MRRDKLTIYIDILKCLLTNGPMKITPLAGRINVNASSLREIIDFMVKQELIEMEKVTKKRVSYKITRRGIRVLDYFNELKDVFAGLESMQSLPILINKPIRKRGERESN